MFLKNGKFYKISKLYRETHKEKSKYTEYKKLFVCRCRDNNIFLFITRYFANLEKFAHLPSGLRYLIAFSNIPLK